jgi:hypothetical protein
MMNDLLEKENAAAFYKQHIKAISDLSSSTC